MAPRKKSAVTPPDTGLKDTVTTDSQTTEEKQEIVVQTSENSDRKGKAVMEKAKDSEKDHAPVIIFSYTDSAGRRQTRTYSCASVKLQTFQNEDFTKSSKRTTLTLNIDAEVLERS